MPIQRPSLSCAVIAKNEAENVERWFKSLDGLFDEMIFVDTGSTDGTQEIAKKLGCKVFHFDWIDDFAAARNFAFDQVKTDFAFWNDLDDVLDNREGFKNWRDTVMELADYHAAPYHYSLDPQGNPVCTFARERVIRMNKGMKWKYFIHEGVIPHSPYGPVKTHLTQAWSIKHMRTASDLAKDRSRNLRIFEKNLGNLDARMLYYYGKELFETDNNGKAQEIFDQALSSPGLEIHDRILCTQFACYALMKAGNFQKALELAHTAIMLAPNRAEFHSICGDCYLKLGRIHDAIPYFEASKACESSVPGSVGQAIFSTKDLYTTYPRNQLARIHFHLGDIKKAKEQAKESMEMGSQEGKSVLEEIEKIHSQVTAFDQAKPCEDIVITCSPNGAYEWDGEIYKNKSMGGSETAAIEMAQWLHKLSGRPVKIFNPRTVSKTVNGVEYLPTNDIHDYMRKNKPWLHIAWRHNLKVTDAPTFLWCHDLYTPGGEDQRNYNKMLCLTPFHKRYVQSIQGVPEDKILITRNGLEPSRFSDGPWEKDPWKFVFSSSPDRGLDRAMRVLDRVREKYPQIKLHVFYGIEHLHKYGHEELQKKLKLMMEERKDWVVYHGATEQVELMRQFKTAAYCLQPSDFIETSMISALERVCCGVYQIIRKIGGLVDTLADAEKQGMADLVASECITETEYDLYAERVIQAIESEAYKRVNYSANSWSWESVAKEWLEILPKERIIETNGTSI